MTTEIELAEVDEVSAEAVEDRPIETLLKLGTYQGMTDSEIESVLEARLEIRMQQEEFQLKANALQEEMNCQANYFKEQAEYAKSVLDGLISQGASFKRVSPKTTIGTEVTEVDAEEEEQ